MRLRVDRFPHRAGASRMLARARRIGVLIVGLLVVSCAHRQVSMICAGDVENGSGGVIRDMRIVHEPTGRFFAVGALQPGKSFFLDFGPRELEATAADVTWTDVSGSRHRARLGLTALRERNPGGPFRLVYSIGAAGQASVSLRPCQSSP